MIRVVFLRISSSSPPVQAKKGLNNADTLGYVAICGDRREICRVPLHFHHYYFPREKFIRWVSTISLTLKHGRARKLKELKINVEEVREFWGYKSDPFALQMIYICRSQFSSAVSQFQLALRRITFGDQGNEQSCCCWLFAIGTDMYIIRWIRKGLEFFRPQELYSERNEYGKDAAEQDTYVKEQQNRKTGKKIKGKNSIKFSLPNLRPCSPVYITWLCYVQLITCRRTGCSCGCRCCF